MFNTVIDLNPTRSNRGMSKTCPGAFITGHCVHDGIAFLKVLYCGKEWCPICGQKDSVSHLRRLSRWLPKAMKLKKLGYFVLTIPPELRHKFRDKESLSWLTKQFCTGYKSGNKWIPGYLCSLTDNKGTYCGYPRGFVRWHFFGDENPGVYNPHLNVIVEHKWLRHSVRRKIERAWSDLLGSNRKVVINYNYKPWSGYMYHCLQYVTRSTFIDYDWSPDLAKELIGWRNMRVWGWSKGWQFEENKWTLEHKVDDTMTISKLENSCCPVCGNRIKWGRAINIKYIHPIAHRLSPLCKGAFILAPERRQF